MYLFKRKFLTIQLLYLEYMMINLFYYNLISNDHNCIENSILPSFIIRKIYQKDSYIRINRATNNTAINHSYDCYTKI